jgi:DNA repair exonuclease SbcCD ATPase subunit
MPDHAEMNEVAALLGVATHELRQVAGILTQRITDAATIAEPAPDLDALLAENRNHAAAMQQIDGQIAELMTKRAEHDRGFTVTQSEWRSKSSKHSDRQTAARQRLLKTCDPRIERKRLALGAEQSELHSRIAHLQQNTIPAAITAAEQAPTMAKQIKCWRDGQGVLVEDDQSHSMELPDWLRQIRSEPGVPPAIPANVSKAERLLDRVKQQGAGLADHRAELSRLQTRLAEVENEIAKLERLKFEPASIAWGTAPVLVKSGIEDGLIVEY